jgi:hypothetical protein
MSFYEAIGGRICAAIDRRQTSRSDTEQQKKHFRKNPKKLLRYWKHIETALNPRFKFIVNGTAEAEAARAVCYDFELCCQDNGREILKLYLNTVPAIGNV